MSDIRAEGKRLASTLPADMMPTQTSRPLDSNWMPSLSASGTVELDEQKLPEVMVTDGEGYTSDGDLVIEYLIGTGGLGVVDAAMQSCLQREVAVKRVRPERRSASASTRLRREAYLMGQLEHPAIPPVHLLGSTPDGDDLFVMKRITGVEWGDLLAEEFAGFDDGQLDAVAIRKHLGILIRIGEALSFAHSRGIIHRDLKPENVVVGDFGEMYLIDWGIACSLPEGGVFEARGFVGTPCYAAPEMLSRDPKLDVRTDVYLLGATMYHMMTGHPPHMGDSIQAVFEMALQYPVPSLSDAWPSPLKQICIRAMAADPDDRYSSVLSMLEDIRYFLEYGELSDLESKCDQELAELELQIVDEHLDEEAYETIGTKCRFGLERLQQAWPGNERILKKLERCLLLVCQSAISKRRIAAARVLLLQYIELVGWEGNTTAHRMKDRIDGLADQLTSRSDELGLNIQVRLVEELASQKRAYDELLVAYREQEGDSGN
ncbi:MAG: serine/threonine protein kinase [Phycisphaerae bacterium]|nr:serine/threonine protein kinase [Phycisphaerae bacterium]